MDKKLFNIKDKRIARKEQAFVKAKGGGGTWVEIEPEKVDKPTLTDAQVEEICKAACMIESHYGYPQDIEWAYEKNILHILQTRRAKIAGG